VEGSVAFNVMVIQDLKPTQKVAQRQLRLGIACPMQRRALSVVFAPYVHADLFEEVQRQRLVPLSCNVQHIDAEVIFNLHVSSIVQQQPC
jgi:hypothetical protein